MLVDPLPGEPASRVWTPLRSRARLVAVPAALLAGVAHIPVIGPHLREAPYMGEEFVVLTVACLLLAVALVICDSVAAYGLLAVAAGLAVLGYAATRLVSFPQLADDVGDWAEPLGLVSVAAETACVVAALFALLGRLPADY
jgi:hypothetical protein